MSTPEIIISSFEIVLRILVLLFLFHISRQLKEYKKENKNKESEVIRRFYLPALILIIIASLFIVLEIPKIFMRI